MRCERDMMDVSEHWESILLSHRLLAIFLDDVLGFDVELASAGAAERARPITP